MSSNQTGVPECDIRRRIQEIEARLSSLTMPQPGRLMDEDVVTEHAGSITISAEPVPDANDVAYKVRYLCEHCQHMVTNEQLGASSCLLRERITECRALQDTGVQ